MAILSGIYYSHPHLFGRGDRGHREIVARLEDGAIISIPGIVLVEEVSVAGPQCCRSWQRQGSKGCHDVLTRSAEARSLKTILFSSALSPLLLLISFLATSERFHFNAPHIWLKRSPRSNTIC